MSSETITRNDLTAILNEVLPPNKRGWFYANGITATTITVVNSGTKIPITIMVDGSGFEYDNTNKGIKCTKAGTYMISCSLSANPATSGDLMGVAIYRNGSSIIGPEYKRMGGNYDVVVLSPTMFPLAENDVITIFGRNNTAARGTFTNCRLACWQVE